MSGYAIEQRPGQIKILTPRVWVPTRLGAEAAWDQWNPATRKAFDRLLKLPGHLWEDFCLRMAGGNGNFALSQLQQSLTGRVAFTAATPAFVGLWTSTLDATSTGATAGEITYTSYVRLSLTNNQTIFPAGSGSSSWVNNWPGDATKSFATSTGGSTGPVTFLILLSGNAGTTADKNYNWCSVSSTTINLGDTPQLAQNAVAETWT